MWRGSPKSYTDEPPWSWDITYLRTPVLGAFSTFIVITARGCVDVDGSVAWDHGELFRADRSVSLAP
jgi:hypothetical protein